MQDALSACRILPLLLNHPVIVAEAYVPSGTRGFTCRRANAGGGAGGSGSEIEVALIGVLIAAGVKPGIQIGIRDGFKLLMREHVDKAIRSANIGRGAVGTCALDFAAAGATIRISDERILDIGSRYA